MIFFLFFFLYMCICIVHSQIWVLGWVTWLWSPVDWGASGVLDVQSVCDPHVFLFDGCLLFPRPLSSTHLHVPLFLLTALFQPSSWSKGGKKTGALHRRSSQIRKWLTRKFFSTKKRKKIYLASPVSRPPPLGYTHSKQSRLFWELSAEAAVQTSLTLPFHFPHSGQCFRKGVPILY